MKYAVVALGMSLFGTTAHAAEGLTKTEAAQLIQEPMLEIHCEDGDGDTYNMIDVFQSDDDRSKFAIIATRNGEEAENGEELLLAEAAKRDKKLSPVAVDGRFEVAKFVAPSITVTVYQQQYLGGDLECVVESEIDELDRTLDGSMDGFTK